MSKLLAVSWNTSSLRFVYGESSRTGGLRIIQAQERAFVTVPQAAAQNLGEDHEPADHHASDAGGDQGVDGDQAAARLTDSDTAPAGTAAAALTADPADPAQHIAALVKELKASKATLLLCLNRGTVEAATFGVPPASTAELPAIVRNMAQRHLTGLNEDSAVDFIAYPADANGGRTVNVMVLPATEQQLVERIAKTSGCVKTKALVTTHALSLYAAMTATDSDSAEAVVNDSAATLVISKGQQSAHLLVVREGLPVLSRSLRLAPNMRGVDEADHIAAEVSRTLLTGGSALDADDEIRSVIVVGSEVESATLVHTLSDQLGIAVHRVSVRSVVEGEAGDASVSACAPLVAAMKLEAQQTPAVVDFLHPKRPVQGASQRTRVLLLVAVVALLVGGGWYFVQAQFAEAQAENQRLKLRLKELDELVRDTRSKRNLAKVLTAWESSRLSWLDELRDLTIRTPSSPELALQQFSGATAGSGYVVSFRGTSRSPQVIRQMEEQLRDAWHEPRTPGIREVKDGKNSLWSFQTTMQLKSRRRDQYVSHLQDKSNAPQRSETARAVPAERSDKTGVPQPPELSADNAAGDNAIAPVTAAGGQP